MSAYERSQHRRFGSVVKSNPIFRRSIGGFNMKTGILVDSVMNFVWFKIIFFNVHIYLVYVSNEDSEF